ncbi:K(+)-transporting ATPase subunit F [Streptomyces sp. NPDC059708]
MRVDTENIVGVIIAVCLVGYLVLAYLFPEKF